MSTREQQIEARKPKRYFPLEFGETWLNAQQHDSELYARISPIIDELKRELHRDISNSTTPMARLRNAVEARVVIVRIKENLGHLHDVLLVACWLELGSATGLHLSG